jgi:rhodanese-related sulfurtransferase
MKKLLLFITMLFSTSVFAGYSGTNKLITSAELLKNKQDYVVLDVRSADEFAEGHIEGAINIPHYAVLDEVDMLKALDKPIVVHCRSGVRATKAENMLMKNGVTNMLHLQGDMLGWVDKDLPLIITK